VHVVRFGSYPIGGQGYEATQMVVRLVEALGPSRSRLKLKRFPATHAPQNRPAALERLPHLPESGLLRGPESIRFARLVVIPYPDTSLIEAMVLGTPLIGLWNPAYRELSPAAEPIYERFTELGVFFGDPASAAAQVDATYEHADEWWSSPAISQAREEFIRRFAAPGDWLSDWAELLRERG
jgi:putative transferase (TIGR04331 family)